MGFLEIILIITGIFYLLGILGKYLLRRFIARKQQEFEERFDSGVGGFYKQYTWGAGNQNNQKPQNEGEIKVTKISKTIKKVNNQVGDYVEYEEVDTNENDCGK